MKTIQIEEENTEMQMAPMIDIVFQLIIFFMCATTFQTYESELKTNMPVDSQSLDMSKIENVIVFIERSGRILVEGREYDSVGSNDLPQLVTMLRNLKSFFENPPVIIQSDVDAKHQRVVDVLNACAAAGINSVTFTEQ
jgi:biopolymer transport protein ExbD